MNLCNEKPAHILMKHTPSTVQAITNVRDAASRSVTLKSDLDNLESAILRVRDMTEKVGLHVQAIIVQKIFLIHTTYKLR